MEIITGERTALSGIIIGAADATETDELDFDLAATQGIVINAIENILTTDSVAADRAMIIQAFLSLDADDNDVPWTASELTDFTDVDSAYIFMNMIKIASRVDDGAGGGANSDSYGPVNRVNWYGLPFDLRPKAINNPIHGVRLNAAVSCTSLLIVRYHIVNFSTSELGILHAYRRF